MTFNLFSSVLRSSLSSLAFATPVTGWMMDSTVNPLQSSIDLPSLSSTLREAFISSRDRVFSTDDPSPSEENGAGEALPSTSTTTSTLWESLVLACNDGISTDVLHPSEENGLPNDIHNLTVAGPQADHTTQPKALAAAKENATLSDQLRASQRARHSCKRKISNLHTRLCDTIITHNAEIALLQRRSTNLETRLVDTVAAKDAENARLQEELRALHGNHQAYVMRDVVRRAGVPDERDWAQAVQVNQRLTTELAQTIQVNQRLTTELAQTIQDRDMALAKCGELIGNLQKCARLNVGLEGELQVAKGVEMDDDDGLRCAKAAFKDALRKCYELRKDADIAEGEMALLREKVGEEEAARISKRAKVLAVVDGGDPEEDEILTLQFEPTQEESDEYRAIVAEKKGAVRVFAAQEVLPELQLLGLADARTI